MVRQSGDFSNASIVDGAGEGIPSASSGDAWWHSVLWATVLSPILSLYAATGSEWLGMALLLTAFAFPFTAIVTYKRQYGITNRLRFLAIAAVSGSNLATWMVSRNIPGIYASISVGKTVTFAEILIPLTLLYIPFGAFQTFPATRSPEDGVHKGE